MSARSLSKCRLDELIIYNKETELSSQENWPSVSVSVTFFGEKICYKSQELSILNFFHSGNKKQKICSIELKK